MKDTRLSEAIVNAQADVIGTWMNGGTLDFYEDPRPLRPEDAPTGNLIGSVTFRDPAFIPAIEGVIVSYPIASGVVYRQGRVSWARMASRDAVPAMDVSVGIDDDDTNCAVSFVDWIPGMEFTNFTFTHTVARQTDGI